MSVALVDLDPKPLDKIPTYYQQASAIRASFQDTATSAATDDSDKCVPTKSVSASTMTLKPTSLETKSRAQGQAELLWPWCQDSRIESALLQWGAVLEWFVFGSFAACFGCVWRWLWVKLCAQYYAGGASVRRLLPLHSWWSPSYHPAWVNPPGCSNALIAGNALSVSFDWCTTIFGLYAHAQAHSCACAHLHTCPSMNTHAHLLSHLYTTVYIHTLV